MTFSSYRNPGSSQTINYTIDRDPTLAPGIPAEDGALVARTDLPSIYYHSGPLDTDWTLIGSGISSDGIVFRPYSPIPSHANVYTTLDEVIAILAATSTLGIRNLYFDFKGSPTFGPPSYGQPSWMMPDGKFDMTNVVWKDIPSNSIGFEGGNTLFFSDNCHVRNLSKIDGSSLIIMNISTTNTPIELDSGCAKLHLSGFVMFCNDSIAEYHPNPGANPVIKYAEPGVFYEIYSDSAQVMLGLYGQGPQTYQDTNTPPPPVLDLNGTFSILRCQFNTQAVTSSVPGAFLTLERISDEIGCGFNIQDWEFVNPGNITLFCSNMTRVGYWNDNNQGTVVGSPLGYGVISSSTYSITPRSGQYQPYPPANATHYLAIHNQIIFCDPTLSGAGDKLVIELPTSKVVNGEVIRIVDTTGQASVLSPIIVNAKAGEFIIDGAGPAASIMLTTPWVSKEFVCNALGQWIAVY